jgi:hypothetical protein
MENQKPKFGLSKFAETGNVRLAMFGFFIGVATELLTGQGILSQLGNVIIQSVKKLSSMKSKLTLIVNTSY